MSFSASRPLPLSDTPDMVIVTAEDPVQLEAIRVIFREYADSLGIDLGFQGFDEELRDLPGEYAEPRGALLLALIDVEASGTGTPPSPTVVQRQEGRWSHVAACCALRPLDAADYPNAAEMKRLYVRPAFRGRGLGRQLTEAVLDAARSAGYSCVLLDTFDDMEAARALYEDLGFVEVPPYYHNPLPGAHYLMCELS